MRISSLPEARLPLSQLRGSLPPAIPIPSHPRWGVRWLQRRFHRYQPGAILAFFGALVLIPLFLDLFVPPVRDWIDQQAKAHEVGVNLLEHILVAALVAAAAFYWVLGLKRQRALTRYRRLAQEKPWELVEWSRGQAPLVRRATCKLLADGIERSTEPAVAVVQGRAGTGRTSFLVGLVQDLAERNLIPIPVLVNRDGSFPLDLARETFRQSVDEVLSSDQQADEIWHRAKATRDVVVLVDGLDDEVVGTLWRDDGLAFRKTIKSLRDQRIAVVLATTQDLPLGDVTPLREDLDLFSLDEAVRYVTGALKATEERDDALAALARQRDPVDGFLIAPFYLDLVVRLERAGIRLHDLPEHRDRWRALILGRYLDAIRAGHVSPRGGVADPEAPDGRSRGVGAVAAAETLAERFATPRADLTVSLNHLKVSDRALRDAVDLNLLWHGIKRVGFAADDLGAYLVAESLADPGPLLTDVCRIAENPRPSQRRDRHVLAALIFLHLRRPRDEQSEIFGRLLDDLDERRWTRPAVVAGVVRIASACGLTEHSRRVAAAADRCIDSLDTSEEREVEPWHAAELLRLVRALADWPNSAAHRLLWRLATNRNIEVEWPAAKALAMAKDRPAETIREVIEERLKEAETSSTPAEMSRPADRLGNEIASLAWILPALRGADGVEAQLDRVSRLCLSKDMSPLRGEMSLAQGLKFAVLNGRSSDRNVAHIRALLAGNGGPRFWHARLTLIQALLAHAWDHLDDAHGFIEELTTLRSREPHPLVRNGIDLARRGLRDGERSSNGNLSLSRYMWVHERDAVRWVEQGKANVARLAADTVLLSNMTYRLRTIDPDRADSVAGLAALPRCIRKSAQRENITYGCECAHGLCANAEDPAVVATRARFSDSFCREQARLVAQLGSPPWTERTIAAYRSKRRLEEFWDCQASIAQSGRTPTRAGVDDS